jgi:hypothetical protein
MRNARSTTRHQFVPTAAKSTHQKRKMIAGNWRKTKLPPGQLKIVEKRLKVHGVLSRNRDVAAGESDIK